MRMRLLRALSRGEPISRVWVAFVAIGGVGSGLLSVPSSGPPVALIPLFMLSGAMCLWGSVGHSFGRRSSYGVRAGRPAVIAGLALMTIACLSRAIAIWGIDQHGLGSSAIATFVWAWISVGCIMLLISVNARGMA